MLGIRDVPRWRIDPLRCLWEHTRQPERCTTPRREALSRSDPTDHIVGVPNNVSFVDLTDEICTGERCPGVRNGLVTYRDQHHLTATFAASLAPALDEALVQGVMQR